MILIRHKALFATLLVLAALAYLFLSRSGSAIPVRVAAVQRGPVVSTITSTTSGSVEPRASATLSAEFVARVTEKRVEEGQRVLAGEVLVTLDPEERNEELAAAVAGRAAARARLAQAVAKRKEAERELRRTEALYQQRVLSRRLLDAAILDAKVSARGVEEAQATVSELDRRVALSRIRHAKAEVKSPFDGIVTEIHIDEGDTVTIGRKILEIADDSRTHVEAPIDEIDAAKIRLEQRARLIPDAYPDQIFYGRVYEISPIVSTGAETNRTIRIKVALDRDDPGGTRDESSGAGAFKLGMSVDVEVILAQNDSVLYVPTFAVIERSGKKFVLTAEGGKAREREIATGLSNWETSEVTSGLSEGELVITSLNDKSVREGARISVEESGEKPGG